MCLAAVQDLVKLFFSHTPVSSKKFNSLFMKTEYNFGSHKMIEGSAMLSMIQMVLSARFPLFGVENWKEFLNILVSSPFPNQLT